MASARVVTGRLGERGMVTLPCSPRARTWTWSYRLFLCLRCQPAQKMSTDGGLLVWNTIDQKTVGNDNEPVWTGRSSRRSDYHMFATKQVRSGV